MKVGMFCMCFQLYFCFVKWSSLIGLKSSISIFCFVSPVWYSVSVGRSFLHWDKRKYKTCYIHIWFNNMLRCVFIHPFMTHKSVYLQGGKWLHSNTQNFYNFSFNLLHCIPWIFPLTYWGFHEKGTHSYLCPQG